MLLFSLACNSSSSTAVTAPSSTRCTIQAQAERTAFPPAGGTATLRIAANRECAWSVSSQAGWVSVSGSATGEGEGAASFVVAANADPSSRTGRIQVNDQEIVISQEAKPCEFRLSSNDERFDVAGGQATIDLTASSAQCEWNARSDADWIEIVSAHEGKGSGRISFEVDPLSGPSRTGTLIIAGIAVRVEQMREPRPTPAPAPACTFTIAPVTFSFGAPGGSGEVHVTASAGCAWAAETPPGWITFSGASSGSGPGVLGFRVSATDGPARTGLLRLANAVVSVNQSPGCAFDVSPASERAPSAGGSIAIVVSTGGGCAWSATSATPWLRMGTATGNGPGRVELTIQANTGPERSGTVVVAGRTVTVTQSSGCRYDVSPQGLDEPPGGGTRPVSVATAAGCPWTATSGEPWVTASPPSGAGPGQVQLTVAPNSTPARTGRVTIAGHAVTIKQSSPCTFMLNPESSSFSAEGGQGLVLVFVTGTCTWTTSSGAGWIRLDSAASDGPGSGFVRFTVAPNGGAARTGTVVIAGIPHSVAQAAK